MKGKAHCPHCKHKVVVEVPDEAHGEQIVACPQCGVQFKVNVDEPYSWEEDAPLIHPSVRLKNRSMKPPVAGLLLIIIFLLGVVISGVLFFSLDVVGSVHMESQFQGTVVDEEGTALAGVTVTVTDHPELMAVTDAEGRFSFPNITSGRQELQFMEDGYKTLKAKVFVFPWNVSIAQERFVLEAGQGTEQYKSLAIRIFEMGPLLAAVLATLSTVALVGGIMALLRRHFIVALVGGVCGIVAGFFSIVGIPLGIVAIILLLLSREEFQGEPVEMRY